MLRRIMIQGKKVESGRDFIAGIFQRPMSVLLAQRGFTLLESLIVLFCLAVIITLTIPFYRFTTNEFVYDQAREKFFMTVVEAQSIAEERQVASEVAVQHDGLVTLKVGVDEIISKWYLPPEMKISIYASDSVIRYTKNGTISRPGRIVIRTPNGETEYSINFTYGRMKRR